MSPRLGQHPFAPVDQNDGDIRCRGSGDHVARILLVARCIGHDELALVGREEAIGNIDGDALFALGGKSVDQ
ncbi:hypothetical protein D3C75_1334470 [compost metagenome]